MKHYKKKKSRWIRVIKLGQSFPGYVEWADRHNFKNFCRSPIRDIREITFKVIASGPHGSDESYGNLLGVEDPETGEQYIICESATIKSAAPRHINKR